MERKGLATHQYFFRSTCTISAGNRKYIIACIVLMLTNQIFTRVFEMEVRKVVIEAGKQLGVDLKNEQIEAVELFVKKMDVFVILPTGYDKPMCYACLPLPLNYHF